MALKAALLYDPKTGEFVWKVRDGIPNRTNSKFAGKIAGSIRDDGYRTIRIFGRLYYAHVLAWFYVTGKWPKHLIDHEDTDEDNNAFYNLRQAGRPENGFNRGPNKNNKSGFKGVSQHGQTGKWVARIGGGGEYKHLGCFDTPEEASTAYCAAAKRIHGEFSRVA